ncbi:MAG: ABC transporter substrate-binding protein [Flexibacteraceae bacterium]
MKTKLLLPIIFLFVLVFTACKEGKSSIERTETSRVFTDALGDTVKVNTTNPKVMALSPALTEMLFAVLPDSQILAVSQACNYPEAVKTKKRINTYPLDIEGLIAIKPEVVFYEEGFISAESISQLRRFGIQTFAFRYNKVVDVFSSIKQIGTICGQPVKAENLAKSLQNQADSLLIFNPKPLKTLAIISAQPVYVFGKGTILSEIIEKVGGTNVVDSAYGRYPEIQREALLKMNPEVILGGSFSELDSALFSKYPELKAITAYQNKQCYPLTSDLVSRPSPRIVEAMKEVKKALELAKKQVDK